VFERVGASWGYLNSLTHGGYEQLIRRVSANGDIMPNFSDADVEQTIRFATTDLIVLLFLCSLRRDVFKMPGGWSANSSSASEWKR
jgi:hypothetical protein